MITLASELRLPAVEIPQGPHHTLYAFGVDGKIVSQIATISRVRRNAEVIEGYQRPEILSHIAEIRSYLDSPDPMIPNAVVIAFDTRVHFEADSTATTHGLFRTGTLLVPLSSQPLPGFIVDGQQRLAAIRECSHASFPVVATAFITDDIHEQMEQFILVNATKPLPKSLIYELLPNTRGHLPTQLRRRRFPSILLERLNRDSDSPFRGRIQTPTTPGGVIKDNSVLRMLENSLTDGVLYRYAHLTNDATEEVLVVVKAFWRAVAATFEEAWRLTPKRSRLVHGAGILSMGFVMDAMAERYRKEPVLHEALFADDLKRLAPECRWTDGFWPFGPGHQRKWNEIQNTSPDIQLLSNYLLAKYKMVVWDHAS